MRLNLLRGEISHLTGSKSEQKPRKITLNQALKMTLIYHLYNSTEKFLAHIFDISQPTVSRIINLTEQALLQILESVVRPLEKALNFPDPTGSLWKAYTSIKMEFIR